MYVLLMFIYPSNSICSCAFCALLFCLVVESFGFPLKWDGCYNHITSMNMAILSQLYVLIGLLVFSLICVVFYVLKFWSPCVCEPLYVVSIVLMFWYPRVCEPLYVNCSYWFALWVFFLLFLLICFVGVFILFGVFHVGCLFLCGSCHEVLLEITSLFSLNTPWEIITVDSHY